MKKISKRRKNPGKKPSRANSRKESRGQKAARTSALQRRRMAEQIADDEARIIRAQRDLNVVTRRQYELTKGELQNRRVAMRAAKRADQQAKVARKQERADKSLAKTRKKAADHIRAAMTAKARVKLIRPYVEGFDADSGYNLSHAKEWDKKQIRKAEKVYGKLSALLLKPHVRVGALTPARLKALTQFQGIEKPIPGMKAVPVVTPAPEKTRVTVADGIVQVEIADIVQRHFFIPEDLEDEVSASTIARKMLRDMPDGIYFIKTGEHEAYRQGSLHRRSTPMRDNLLFRQLKAFVNQYGAERVEKFFRGFRWIAAPGNASAARKEANVFIKERQRLDAERAANRKRAYGAARRRARRIVKK